MEGKKSKILSDQERELLLNKLTPIRQGLRILGELLYPQDATALSPPIEKQDHSIKKPLNKSACKKKTRFDREIEIIWHALKKKGYKKSSALDAWVKNAAKFTFIKEGMLEDNTLYPKIRNKNSKRDFSNALKKKIRYS